MDEIIKYCEQGLKELELQAKDRKHTLESEGEKAEIIFVPYVVKYDKDKEMIEVCSRPSIEELESKLNLNNELEYRLINHNTGEVILKSRDVSQISESIYSYPIKNHAVEVIRSGKVINTIPLHKW